MASPFRNSPAAAPWRPQFTLRGMLLAMLLFTFVAALLGLFVRKVLAGGQNALPLFVILSLTIPLAVALLFGCLATMARYVRWRRGPRRTPSTDADPLGISDEPDRR